MLGHEYNCANDDTLIKHQLVNLSDIRIIHYLRKNEFDRHDFLCDREQYDGFIGEVKKCDYGNVASTCKKFSRVI